MLVNDLPDAGFLPEAKRLSEPEVDIKAVGLPAGHMHEPGPEGDVFTDSQLDVDSIAADRALPGR